MRSKRPTIACALVTLALLGAACSSSKKSAPASSSTVTGGGSASGTPAPTTTAALTPKAGGNLVMGTEAEIDGFDPTKNRWDVTGYMYADSVYDPLAAFGADNKVHPYLAESITPNADYTQWKIKVRPNVTFSNGDPVTGDTIVKDLTAIKAAALTGQVYDNIASIAVDPSDASGMTALVTCTTPWVPFPIYLTGQAGVVFDPKMLTDPNSAQHPIGTGPFILKEWVPGNHFIATKNPNYWQKGLPYLDSVEFRPILETTSRDNSVASGTIDIMHSSDPQTRQDLKGNKGVQIITDAAAKGEVEEEFVMLNTGKPPLDDVTIRQALAYATDRNRYNQIINYGLVPDSTGPFGNPGSPFHADTGYPSYDLTKAKALVAQYEQAHHVTSVSFELGTTNNARNLQTVSLLQSMWGQAGITVTIKQVEQSQFILLALEGKYDAYTWRQFGEPDPDADYIWWSSTTALAEGKLALNFSRNKDPQIDADLLKGRTSADPATRAAAYEDIASQFAKDVPFVWTNETVWTIAAKTNVQGILQWTLPDGTPGVDHTIGGAFSMAHVWVG